MLTIDRIINIHTGAPLNGFFVRNRKRKALAFGSFHVEPLRGFVMPLRKRYARDVSLCRRLANLTGLPVKWNLSYWCNRCTSGTEQELRKFMHRGGGRA